jgi:hypothetical protein
MPQVKVTPSGNLDKDTELSYISKGNYVDANDIRHRQVDGNNFGGVMGIDGNLNLITTVNGSAGTTLPSVSATSTGYRIYFDLTPLVDNSVIAVEGDLTLENSSGTIFSNLSLNISTTTVATFVSTLKGFFNTLAFAAYGSNFTYPDIGGYVSTGTYTGYFNLSTLLDTNYVLRVNNYVPTAPLCNIVLVSEYIATGTTLRPIGSFQLEDYLFVWSASELSTGVKSNVSEIGVIYSTTQGVNYQYKTLCRTSKLGFFKERRLDIQAERVGSQINFYWTDGNEKPRAMYLDYSKVTTQNGFMYWEGGRYEHNTIDEETAFFFKVSKGYIDEITVVNEGGSITAGNKRYTGRFLSEDLVASEFLYPTNPVNIYPIDTITPSLIHGAESNVITSKSVTMVVKNIPPNIYKFFELAVIEYVDDAFTTTIVQRYTIGDGDTQLNVSHVSKGQDNIPLGVNELVALFVKYVAAENIRIHDNRIVLSNLKEQVDLDLEAWALDIEHSLESKSIPALGNIVKSYHEFLDDPALSPQPSPILKALTYDLNENLDPLNTLNNTSYMFNDTYRFGIQVKWKNTGKWSAPYYVDDIRFDSLATNVVGTRRTANNITSNLTDSSNQNVFINYVKFSNINLDYLVGGVPLRNLIDGFRFVRAERIPEVLATGYFILGKAPNSTTRERFDIAFGSILGDKIFSDLDVNTTTDIINIVGHGLSENESVKYLDSSGGALAPLVDGFYYYVNVINANDFKLREVPNGPTINFTSVAVGTDYTLERGYERNRHTLTPVNGSDVLFFHSPDHYYIDREYGFDKNTHSIKILGPAKNSIMVSCTNGSSGRDGIYADFTGHFSSAKREYLTITNTGTLHIDDYILVDISQEKTLSTSSLSVRNKGNLLNDVFGLSVPLRPSSGSNFAAGLANSEDEGVFYGQIFLNLGANKKYPANKENTIYHSTGHIYFLTESDTGIKNNVDVFGGDVFTQKTHLPISLKQSDTHPTMVGCYSQNLVNAQMYTVEEDDTTTTGLGYRWPVYSNFNGTVNHKIQPLGFSTDWVEIGTIWTGLINFLHQENPPQRFYNRSYDYKDRTLLEKGFFKNDNYTGESPTKVIWSAKKATGSNRDAYRLGFGPTEFAELDLSYGPIVHQEIINNSFYTMQPFSFQRQYFRDASLIGAQEGSDVVVGSGSILGTPGQELSSIGSEFKWSQLKGQTLSGKESFYWYNNRLKKLMRFAMDGVQSLSERGVVSLLQNNTNWLYDKKYPLSGTGIHGVWNDKYSEAIFTFKALNPNIPTWVTSTSYTIGSYVFITPITTYVHSSGLPFVYKAKTNHTSGTTTKPETGANWQTNWTRVIPGTDAYAHTCISLVYDEIKNGFVSTHSYFPDIYLPFQNTFWSPNPNAKNTLFLHDENNSTQYYGSLYIPNITAVMNLDPNLPKNFEAVQINSDSNPGDVDFFTKDHQSYLDQTDWEYREGYFYSPIKNDILTAPLGSPIEDTSRLWGKWLKVKLNLESGATKQKLVNLIVKFRAMARLYNQ